jgi:catechol 2,3-dioxygenase-like lactoylglutathione lyase family enzyme
MIRGAHFLLYSTNPEADRAFFRDVLGFPFVDDGGGWLIFKLPAAEMGVHPSDGSFQQRHGEIAIAGSVLYLMCDDVRGTVQALESKGTSCAALHEEEWGVSTTLALPSGERIGLYEPKHKLAIEW